MTVMYVWTRWRSKKTNRQKKRRNTKRWDTSPCSRTAA